MAVRRTSHRFTHQHRIVQNSEASDWLRGVRCEYKCKIISQRRHFSPNPAWTSTWRLTWTCLSRAASRLNMFNTQGENFRNSWIRKALSSGIYSALIFLSAHELKWLCCCFQMRSYMFGKKVWQQFGEAEICSRRVSSERHPHLRSSGEGRVLHHPQTSFTFPWRLLQIFPWHPASFPGSLRGCSSVVLGRMNITWRTLHTNHS